MTVFDEILEGPAKERYENWCKEKRLCPNCGIRIEFCQCSSKEKSTKKVNKNYKIDLDSYGHIIFDSIGVELNQILDLIQKIKLKRVPLRSLKIIHKVEELLLEEFFTHK